MNQIRFDANDWVLLNQLLYLTQLDISHNHRIHELDLRLLNNLEYLHCSYNNTVRLILNGHSLKQLNASHNSKELISGFSSSYFTICRIEIYRCCHTSAEFNSTRYQLVSASVLSPFIL